MPEASSAHPAVRLTRWIVPVVAGTAAATGFQPIAFWPATLAAFAVLIALIETAPRPPRRR